MEKNNKRKLTPYWKSVIILSGVIIICNILARIRVVCDFYVDNIFFVWSNTYGRITGIFPFSYFYIVRQALKGERSVSIRLI